MTLLFFVLLVVVLVAAGAAVVDTLATLVWWAITGLVIGALARLLVKGTRGLGLLRTTLAGVAGALGGGLVARAIDIDGGVIEFMIAVLVAALAIAAATGALGRRSATQAHR